MQPPAGKPTKSWAFDLGVLGVGLTLAAWATTTFVTAYPPDLTWLVACAVAVPLIVLMSMFPLRLARDGIGIEVGFESAVLVALVVLVNDYGALTIWAIGQTAAQMTKSHKKLDIRMFNTALTVICGTAAVAVVHLFGGATRTSPHELLAVGTACCVFFVVDYLISALSVALEERTSIGSQLRYNNGLLAGLVFVGINSLGYLAGLVGRSLPPWASVLLGVPLATILIASRALGRAAENQRRLTSLVDATAAISGAGQRVEVLDLLRKGASDVLAQDGAELRAEPPGQQEVGAAVTAAPEPAYLVAKTSALSNGSSQLDQQALDALALVGDQTLARLALVEQLGRQAATDALTGLPNRSRFTELLDDALLRAEPPTQVAVLYLDLDGFKSVNDRFGHSAGDDLLRIVGDRLQALAGARGSVARLGGDEFAVMLADVAHLSEVQRFCERVLATVHREAVVAGHSVVVGTSIGVVLAGGADSSAVIMRNADMAMYSAKALGKNRYRLYEDSLRDDRIRRLELVEALRAGIQTELVVHYQPVVSLASGRVVGMEALVRWEREGGLVPPDQFIPAAEDSGLVVPLGRQVLAQVVADSPALVSAAGGPIDLAVNMSALQLHDPDFPEQVASAVQTFGASRLVLEMTETVLVQDDPRTASTLHALTEAGARLSIDDFGVGFSSIGYLQHLPVDVVKIDRSFVRDIDRIPRARALVEAILVMARALDLDVVAEGIERDAQAAVLTQARCPQGQGYLYARPQPLAQTLETLRRNVSWAGTSPLSY